MHADAARELRLPVLPPGLGGACARERSRGDPPPPLSGVRALPPSAIEPSALMALASALWPQLGRRRYCGSVCTRRDAARSNERRRPPAPTLGR